MSNWWRRLNSTWGALVLFTGLAALFYLPLLLGLRTFPDGDFTHHFLPFSLFQQQEWLAGRFLPMWNPFTYGGHPFLADVQAAVFYPLGDLLLLLTLPFTGAGTRLYFLQVEAVIHVALAGFFMFLFVRDLSGHRRGGLVAGVLFAFSGYLTGYPPLQLAILRTAIWLPLILWLLIRAFSEPHRWRWWTGAILAYATALLAGHPQTFLHLSYAVGAWILLLFLTQRRKDAKVRILGTFAFCTLPFALSAVQWLPSWEFTQSSVRAAVDYAFVSGGFPIRDTWQMVFPDILTQFSPLYVSAVGLVLAVVALWQVAGGAPRRSPVPSPQSPVPILLFTLTALLLSFGGNAFLYPIFYRFAPGWDLFRGQERAAFLVVFGLSVLAGIGAVALTRLSSRGRRGVAIGAILSIICGAGIVYAFLQGNGQTAVDNATFAQIAGISLIFAAATAALLWQPGWSRRRTALLVALAFANLLWAGFDTNLNAFGPARKTILSPEMAALQAAVDARNDANLGLPGRVYNEFRVYEDYGMRLGVEDVWGSSPLRSARYARLFDNFPLDRLWQLTGVEHVLTWRRELFGPSELLAEFPQATDTTFLHRLPDPFPRAWVVSQIHVADDDEAVALLADSAFDLRSTVILAPEESNLPAGTEIPLGPPGVANIQLQRPAPNHLHVDVSSAHGGLLVVSEVWFPGWRIENVTCNGCDLGDAPLRANLTFLGVFLSPGQTTFDLVYRPESVRLGLSISVVSAVILLGVLYWWRGRR
ncbi:MAG: hypothetical protein KDD84_11465 [Caldilineaceae bacterium]|nr:hypothetical protein [Caldilineaceae bacterium]